MIVRMFVRMAAAADARGIAEVTLRTGQPVPDSGADPAYLDLLLRTGSVAVAEDDAGVVAGWGAVRPARLGSLLTDLFVHPERQGEGVGRAILDLLWPPDEGPEPRYTFSSQHPHALPLYIRAGLVPSWPLCYLEGAPDRDAGRGVEVLAVTGGEAAEAEALLIGGPPRTADYDVWCSGDGAGVVVQAAGGVVVAAGAMRTAALAHLVCRADAEPARIVLAVLAQFASDRVALCLPGRHPALHQLVNSGFHITDVDVAMATDGVDLPTGWIYAPGLT